MARPLDYLLEQSLEQRDHISALVAAVNTLGALTGALSRQLEALEARVGDVDLDGTRTARELAALRTAAVTSVEELRRLTTGEVTGVDVMVRDGDGNVSAVVRKGAPTVELS